MMKDKNTFALSLLIIVSINGFGQEQSTSLKSDNITSSIQEIEITNSDYPIRINIDDPGWTLNIENVQSLNSTVANRTYIEKIDSLMKYSWNIDSARFDLQNAEYYLFDALGRNYTYENSWFNPQLGSMVPGNKTIFNWNTDYEITKIINYSWIDSSKIWAPGYRTDYTFDEYGQVTNLTQQSWDDKTGNWYFVQTDTTIYSEEGDIQRRTSYYYDNLMKYWTPSSSEEYSYNENNLPDEIIEQYWYGDTSGFWELSGRTLIYYDKMGRDTAIYKDSWMGEGWDNSYYETRDYDAQGNISSKAYYYWNLEMQRWDGGGKTEYLYDENNRLTESINYGWSYDLGDWNSYNKMEKKWDAKGNLSEQILYNQDTSMQYVNSLRAKFDFNPDMEKSNVAMQANWTLSFYEEPIEPESFYNQLTSVTTYSWNEQTKLWEENATDTLHYSKMFGKPVNETGCKADFDWKPGKDIQEVHFTDMSDTGVVAWYWMFGDGRSSTMQNPRHVYAKEGTYRVFLTTVDALGFCSNTMVKQIKVGNPSCNAAFSYLIDTSNQVIVLLNESKGVDPKFFWSFGDGSISKAMNPPAHTYQYPGAYRVILTVVNGDGSCMDLYLANIKVGSNPCKTDFAVFIDSSSNTVLFRARNVNPLNTYRWVFGDGSGGYGPNRNHRFSHPGYYSASLTVSNALAGCVETRKESLLVGNKGSGVKAGFMYVTANDNTVKFTNQSLGSESLSYHWDFNDTQTSEEENPEHIYVLSGYYDVCLTATSKDGAQNTYCEKIFAGNETKDHCLAKFEYNFSEKDDLKVYFKDRSYGEPDQWYWEFPDNTSSVLSDPDWTAGEAGFARIRQSISNSKNGCRDHAFDIINMGARSRLKAAFGYVIGESNTKAETYPIDFIGVSLGDAGKLKWSFGDGTYDSTSINPVHNYPNPGPWEVCLTITNTTTGEEDTSCEWVTAGQTSTEEMMKEEIVLISYPNPFSHTALVEILLDRNSEIDLSLYDLTGRKIKTIAREYRETGRHIFTLNGAGLEAGNYYLVLETAAGTSRHIISFMK